MLMPIQFGSMFKFQFLAQFPVDHLSHPVLSCYILLHLLIMRLYYYFTSYGFFHQPKLIVFYWSLGDSNSPQVHWTLLSIWADFNNAAIWMVSNCSFISKSFSPFTNPISIALITICAISLIIGALAAPLSCSTVFVVLWLGLGSYLSFHFLLIYSVVYSVDYSVGSLFFLLTITRSGCLAKIRWSVCILKS